MEVQSLSICVPGGCPNNCFFCVSKMQRETYKNQIEDNKAFRSLYKADFIKRLQFARNNGCNTVILTGDGEPLINGKFLDFFSEWNQLLSIPFEWVELQTSGVTLNEETLRHLRNGIGVSTIALSLSDVFDSNRNQYYNQTPDNLKVDIDHLCSEVRRYDFNLRLSLNMTDAYNRKTPQEIFSRCKDLGANQVTFRILYTSGHAVQDTWIEKHRSNNETESDIQDYIIENGRPLEVLPFGAQRYSVEGMSVVVDTDCMSTDSKKETIRYLVLRPNCKLYSKWDDEGSLIF